jgi:hypothetical protein
VTLSSHRTAVSADFGDATEDNSVYETVVQYHRIFHPSETREVRVYLRAGNDTAVVRGESNAITLRVLGGKGDDLFADSSAAGNLYFYDDEAKSSIASLTATRVDTRPYDAPEPSEGVQFGIDWAPDWGSRRTWGTAVDYGGASGVVLGFGPTFTDYHFRRLPYRWRFDLRALVGIAELQPGLDVKADYRFENSMRSVETRASWPGYDSFHWFGRGNDSERVLTDETPVSFDRLEIASSFKSRFGRWRSDAGNDDEDDAESQDAHKDSRDDMRPMRGSIGIGPVLRYTRTSTSQASSFTKAQPLGFRPLWQTGGRAELDVKWTDGNAVPRRGYRVRAAAEGFPGTLDLPGAYATFTGELDGYVPLVGAIHFALRAGAIRTLGHSVPAFDAAAVGGRRTLRGFSSRRFAGETATYGSAELRVPMGEVPLLVRGELGVFALLDAGRVWDRGESPGGWHSGHGLGLWFAAFDRAISAAYAAGEQTKLYLWLGVPF